MITQQELAKAFDDNLLQPMQFVIMSDKYSLPARDWIFNEYAASLPGFREVLSSNQYLVDSNDCVEFSLMAMLTSRIAHSKTMGAGTALAVGFYTYAIEKTGQGHAIIIAFVRENGKVIPVWLEPQTGKEVILSQYERTMNFAIII